MEVSRLLPLTLSPRSKNFNLWGWKHPFSNTKMVQWVIKTFQICNIRFLVVVSQMSSHFSGVPIPNFENGAIFWNYYNYYQWGGGSFFEFYLATANSATPFLKPLYFDKWCNFCARIAKVSDLFRHSPPPGLIFDKSKFLLVQRGGIYHFSGRKKGAGRFPGGVKRVFSYVSSRC